MPAVILQPKCQAPDPGGCGRPEGEWCEIIDLPDEPWPSLRVPEVSHRSVFGEWTHRGFRPLSVLGADATEPFSTAVVARAALGPSSVWEDLVATGQIGTDRRPVPGEPVSDLGVGNRSGLDPAPS